MFSISCFEGSTCLTNIVFGTVIICTFVYTCRCVFLRLLLCVVLFLRCLWSVYATLYSVF